MHYQEGFKIVTFAGIMHHRGVLDSWEGGCYDWGRIWEGYELVLVWKCVCQRGDCVCVEYANTGVPGPEGDWWGALQVEPDSDSWGALPGVLPSQWLMD